MPASRALALAVLAWAAWLLPAAGARADLAKWDQARVTEIAQQLAQASDAWWSATMEPPRGRAEENYDLQTNARMLVERTRGLADDLAKGKGHDETLNAYRSLREIVDDTEEVAQRAMLDAPIMDAWTKVADLMRQIAPYYDPKALAG